MILTGITAAGILDLLSKIAMFSPVGFLSWIAYDRHMNKKKLRQQDLSNDTSQSQIVAANLDLYQRMLDDLGDKLTKAHETIAQLEKQIEELKKAYKMLKEENEKSNN